MLPWLAPGEPFPATSQALDDPNGLLAAGGDLSPQRLLTAYRQGIFPWYDADQGQPIMWWSPSPRCVIQPHQLHQSRSLQKHLRRCGWQVTINRAFTTVMQACAAPREDQDGTWISEEMIAAYTRLQQLGYAHSLEVWEHGGANARLAGALYGLQLGQVFFGESMVSPLTNGSKAALVALSRLAPQRGITLIDCQVENPHLLSLGAELWPRQRFEQALAERIPNDPSPAPWSGQLAMI